MNTIPDTVDALGVVKDAGLWREFVETMTADIASQLDMIESEQDQAVFWSLIVKALSEQRNCDTAINTLEYLLGITSLQDYIGNFMRETQESRLALTEE